MKPFHYEERKPSPALARHAHAYWSFTVRLPPGEPFLHHVWPDGCVSIAVASDGANVLACSVTGPGATALRIPVLGGLTYRGIRLWPHAAAALGIPVASLHGRVTPASDVLGDEMHTFATDVARADDGEAFVDACERWLAPRVANATPIDPLVHDAVHTLIARDGAVSIAQLATSLGIGVRQLARRFQNVVGLTPKAFGRVRRVRATMAVLLDGTEASWSRLAAELGYADHAHLTREFRSVTGFAPTELRERLAAIEHGDVRP